MDANNTNNINSAESGTTPPLTPLNQPSIDLNSTPPMDQTLVPNTPSTATPPPFDPAPVPTVTALPPEEPKKSSQMIKIVMVVLVSVIIIALAYMVVSKFSAGSDPQATPAPVEQDVDGEAGDALLDESEGGTQWRDIDPDNPEGTSEEGGDVTSETPAEVDPNSPVEEMVVEE
jgi:hypothetical protein